MSEEDGRNPTALRAGSRMDTDEGTMLKFTTIIITFRLLKNILLYIVLGFPKSKRTDRRTSKSVTQSDFNSRINQFDFSFVRQSIYM